jgi:hypothetical protein
VLLISGTPGATYTIEFADQLAPANWQKLTNQTAPEADTGLGVGVFEFRDAPGASTQRFYRVVHPAY